MYLYAIVPKSQQEYRQASCFIPDTCVSISVFQGFSQQFQIHRRPKTWQNVSNLKGCHYAQVKFKVLSKSSTSPSLCTPPPLPLSANVWKLILTFQVFRKASSTGDNRCGAWGPSVLGRERVNGPCVTVCICYIFYSPLFKLILEAQHLPNLHRVSGFSSSPACLRGSPSPSFDSFSWKNAAPLSIFRYKSFEARKDTIIQ